MRNFIFVTGGVLSSVGKGVTTGAIGSLLEAMGCKVQILKLDPYLNVDPGTISPYQHGEVFVTDDGAETDLDLGHYERFVHATMSRKNNATAGQMYARIIEKERKGDFLGGTVQVVPHLTEEIKKAIYDVADHTHIVIVEIGGTIGDIEGLPFIEAIRQIGLEKKEACVCYVHVAYIPYLAMAGELKTKPTQHSVKELRAQGIQPNILVGRSSLPLPQDIKNKLALFTNVEKTHIISMPDLDSVYQAPLHMHKEGLDACIAHHFSLPQQLPDLSFWQGFCDALSADYPEVRIAIVGKYVALHDAYKSIRESLTHAQVKTNTKVVIDWVEAEEISQENVALRLGNAQGILVPGGFGERGVEGKIAAVRYAREHNIPYLGICLGMQVAVIEFARNVLDKAQANSTEFNATTLYPVIDLMPDQKKQTEKGGTMRLGSYTCVIKDGTRAHDIYGAHRVQERHRHRYEFNLAYVADFEKHGCIVSGVDQGCGLPEIIELRNHPFFVGCQFHPEFKSRPWQAHPLFVAFVKAASNNVV